MNNYHNNINQIFLIIGITCLSACTHMANLPKQSVAVINVHFNDLHPNSPGAILDENASLAVYYDELTGQAGYKNKEGKIILPAKYQAAHPFNKAGLADVFIGPDLNNWQRIDVKGSAIIKPFIFDSGPDYYVNNLARYVDEKNKIGFNSPDGKIVIRAKYDWASGFWHNPPIAIVCHGGKWGAIDAEGRIIVALKYSDFSYSKHKLIVIFKTKNNSLKLFYNWVSKNYFLIKNNKKAD